MLMVPPPTVSVLMVSEPLSVSMPGPSLVRLPLPLSIPPIVRLLVATVIWPLPMSATGAVPRLRLLLPLKVKSPPNW